MHIYLPENAETKELNAKLGANKSRKDHDLDEKNEKPACDLSIHILPLIVHASTQAKYIFWEGVHLGEA